ncbi:PH domain-containing protein [Mycolicibacterium sp. XJ662]
MRTKCEDSRVSSPAEQKPVVIRISPTAHIAVGFVTLGLLAIVLAGPSWTVVLMVIPVLLSAYIIRCRTVADATTVTARTFLDSQTMNWDDVAGLQFDKGTSAYAHLKDGRRVRLPAVTFSTLPLLTEASGGRVPNPYA